MEKSGIGHVISPAGAHKSTVDSETGAIIRRFEYDGNGDLLYVADRFDNRTVIERDANGVPEAIVSPDGIRTELDIDPDGNLEAQGRGCCDDMAFPTGGR